MEQLNEMWKEDGKLRLDQLLEEKNRDVTLHAKYTGLLYEEKKKLRDGEERGPVASAHPHPLDHHAVLEGRVRPGLQLPVPGKYGHLPACTGEAVRLLERTLVECGRVRQKHDHPPKLPRPPFRVQVPARRPEPRYSVTTRTTFVEASPFPKIRADLWNAVRGTLFAFL